MVDELIDNSGRHPRVLLLSERNIYPREVWRCSFFEFEGILEQIESVEVVAPQRQPWFRNGKRLACRLGEHFKMPMNPGLKRVKLNRHYDLFFTICESAHELLHVNSVKGWKDHCKTSVCVLVEFYVKNLPLYKSCMEVLAQFDHVFFMFDMNEPIQKLIQGKGRYLPPGIDALRFCPFPNPPTRSIDVLSIGRRSKKTHEALLGIARDEAIFYLHDTIDSLHTYDLNQHRQMLANLAKRTRYFLVNPGKIDEPEETGGQSEIGCRYFEGAASGTIMIGDIPRNPQFPKIFHWDGAVIPLAFDSENIGAILNELDAQPERRMSIRQNNVIQSLLHHDWAYRWETVLEIAGLAPLPALVDRKERLSGRAAMVNKAQSAPPRGAPTRTPALFPSPPTVSHAPVLTKTLVT